MKQTTKIIGTSLATTTNGVDVISFSIVVQKKYFSTSPVLQAEEPDKRKGKERKTSESPEDSQGLPFQDTLSVLDDKKFSKDLTKALKDSLKEVDESEGAAGPSTRPNLEVSTPSDGG